MLEQILVFSFRAVDNNSFTFFFLFKLSTHAPKRSVILMPTAFTLDQITTNVPVKKDTKGMVKSAYP